MVVVVVGTLVDVGTVVFGGTVVLGTVVRGTTEVEDDEGTPDQTELSEIRWFTREEARKLLRGEIEGVFCPPPLAIAHQLLKAWAEEA